MTIAELNRKLESWQRVKKNTEKEKAAHNYILANLIGRSIASCFSDDISILSIEEVYPSLFQEEAQEAAQSKREQMAEISAMRFMQFAQSYNKRYEKQEVANTK